MYADELPFGINTEYHWKTSTLQLTFNLSDLVSIYLWFSVHTSEVSLEYRQNIIEKRQHYNLLLTSVTLRAAIPVQETLLSPCRWRARHSRPDVIEWWREQEEAVIGRLVDRNYTWWVRVRQNDWLTYRLLHHNHVTIHFSKAKTHYIQRYLCPPLD